MRILSLEAENILRLSAVHIKPDGSPVVVIAGENEAGKSSVLAAIEMALGGEKRLPKEPMRRGAEKARVVVDLGDIIVTRTFTAAGTKLTVTNRDGAKYPSPQALLDGLISKLTFDPLAFAQADVDAQAVLLRRLAGINTTDLEDAHKKAFDERTIVNREVTRLKGALTAASKHDDVPAEPVSAQAVADDLARADRLADAATLAQGKVTKADFAFHRAREAADAATKRIDLLRAELEAAELASVEADEAVHVARETHRLAVVEAEAAAAVVPDREAMRQRIADSEAVNAKVRANQARREIETQLAGKQAESQSLTEKLSSIEAEKAQRLTSAKFPVEGLGLSDVGVTWNGLPFAQASSAIRIRASVAIGLALNPKLKVLRITNGNDLGQKNLQLLADAAEAAGAQVWVERIAGGSGLQTVVIEDGAVREAVTA